MATPERNGIAVAGTLLVDKINEIRAYPRCGELTKIHSLQKAVGGCVPNVGIDLKKICPSLPVSAIGIVGDDDDGAYIKQILSQNGLDISGIITADAERTSFTDVMSIAGGQRTFFTYAGADGQLTADDIPWNTVDSRILLLGYFLLLEKVDAGQGLAILKKAKELGIETAIDMVSENSDRYALVLPCLPYVDYLIINELEAGKLTGMEPVPENLPAMAARLRELGVRQKVILHMPDRSICCSDDGIALVGSLELPEGYIQGTTGAGDAFCAGALYAIHQGRSDREILEFASFAAVMSLRCADATGGLREEKEIVELCSKFRRKPICL